MNRTYKLELTPEVYQQLQLLKQKTEIGNLGELMRKALALYDCLMDESMKGSQIEAVRKDGSRVPVVLP